MLGERIIIGEDFTKVAEETKDLLLPLISKAKNRYIITIAGESGSGKTGISVALSQFLTKGGTGNRIIQQDDYFFYPPRTNEAKRRENLSWVGMNEIQLDLLEQNLKEVKDGKREVIKPLVIFNENKKTEEKIILKGVKVVIVEGTYTTILKNVDKRIFIDRIYLQTKKERKIKAREKQDRFLEKVLETEHEIISQQKDKADFIITNDFNVVKRSG